MASYELTAPLSVQVELTTRCNNRCPHCYNFQKQVDVPELSMSADDLRTVLTRLEEAQIFAVGFTGGEPFLLPALVQQGVEFCDARGIRCSVNSNLTPINAVVIEQIKDKEFTILGSLASFDEQMHDAMMGRIGAYRQTMTAIRLLREAGIKFGLNMVVSRANADHVYQTGLLAHELGAIAFSATKASPPQGCQDYSPIQPPADLVRNSLRDLLAVKRDARMRVDVLECYPLCFFEDPTEIAQFANHGCSAGTTTCTIGPDGEVRPCSHSDKTYGNLLLEDLPTIFAKMAEWRNDELLPEQCQSCQFVRQCSGGCRYEAKYATGSLTGMDPLATGEVIPHPRNQVIAPSPTELLNGVISVKQSVRFREEGDAYVLWMDGAVIVVDQDAGSLLRRLQSRGMGLDEIVAGCKAEASQVMEVLRAIRNKEMLAIA